MRHPTTQPIRFLGRKARSVTSDITAYEKFTNGGIDDLFETAEVIETGDSGYDFPIFKGELLDSLEGKPFLILGGTFREGINQSGQKSDYVTLMCAMPSEKFLESRKIRYAGNEPWFPEQIIGINDGSTGIRRQVVSYLHTSGIISVQESGSVIKEDGPRGECSWDRLVSEWELATDEITPEDEEEKDRRTTKVHKKSGVELTTWDFSLRRGLLIPRGIRVSTYTGPFKKEITTRYLAR